ncbi:hypothetical protein C8J57DRAFT_1190593 [Mycena rebaudengoi]|nr:hypothetical protein C8J57DRAFT_1190593 [Mycena rebaudengoi]
MATVTLTRKSRTRTLSFTLVASRTAPILEIPTELGFEILELALRNTPFHTLAAVSAAFSALISTIIYRTVVLDSETTLSLFSRTVQSKSPDFLHSHVKTLVITLEPARFTAATRIELERIIASCTGVRTLALPRPGILAAALAHHPLHLSLPFEVIIQSFDEAKPFEWGCVLPKPASEYPAAHLSSSITHLRVCEPGDVWYSPLSILQFFGGAYHLTHLALVRRMNSNTDNDAIFVEEVCSLLVSRPNLKMIVVSIFPEQWPRYFDEMIPATSSSIWQTLSFVAEADPRVVLVEGVKGWTETIPWARCPNFWEHSTMRFPDS